MELSTEQFSDAETAIRAASQRTADGRERRRAGRVPLNAVCPVSLDDRPPTKGETPLQLRVRDLSPRGFAGVFDRPLPHGAQFMVWLPRHGQTPLAVLCAVIHCKQIHSDLFQIGAEFTCVPEHTPPYLAGAPDEPSRSRIEKSILE